MPRVEAGRLRIASLNALHGRDLQTGRVSAEGLAEACASLDADVLCLQEVDRSQRRSDGVDQTAAVAEHLGAHWWRFEPALIGEPGATWRAAVDADSSTTPAEAGYGVGIVSRREVRSWHVVRLAAASVRAPVAVPGGRGRLLLLPDEPRVALVAGIDGPSGVMAVATTHLSFVPGWNGRQLWRLFRELAALAPDVVLAGDLNLPGPPVRALARGAGWRSLVRGATFPAARPSMQIDHVLGRGSVGEVTATAISRLALSDHRAVVVDLGGFSSPAVPSPLEGGSL